MFNSESYWNDRYKTGGTSGPGSYNENAKIKADIINDFVSSNSINTVTDFGCGDGNQLKHFNFNEYLGYDISDVILGKTSKIFSDDSTKEFKHIREYKNNPSDLAMSLEVILHQVNDSDYIEYMDRLLNHNSKYLIVQTIKTDIEKQTHIHVKNRDTLNYILDNSDYKLLSDTNVFIT